jgi:hypothetical protein
MKKPYNVISGAEALKKLKYKEIMHMAESLIQQSRSIINEEQSKYHSTQPFGIRRFSDNSTSDNLLNILNGKIF